MKKSIILLFIFFVSCTSKNSKITHVVLENKIINKTYLQQIDEPEKALLAWYLYAYGNECDKTSTKIKCTILKELQINDECDGKHLNNLLQWFSNDMMVVYKLNKCPNLPIKSAIQNEFKKIVIKRNKDTISINFTVKGLNNNQEKSWNITKIDQYLITSSNFVKLKGVNNEE